jgi:hypothetical protein
MPFNSELPYVVRPLEPWVGPRTQYPERSRFASHWTTTLYDMSSEIAKLGATSWVLQIDIRERDLRVDGGIKANASPASPAVRVTFTSAEAGPLTFACDTYDKWQDNVRAVAMTLRALRAVQRYGAARSNEQYRGWQAISNRPATMTREQAAEFLSHWSQLTQFPPHVILSSATAVRNAYYGAAKRAHPDVTGDDGDTMARLNAARDLLLNGLS